MPYVKDSSSSEASDSGSSTRAHLDASYVVSDTQYAEGQPAGSAEQLLSDQLEPIAVIGMGCRLPGDVKSPAEFWRMMLNQETGRSSRVPSSRFNIDAHFHENNDRPGSFGVSGGYFLNETLQEFDPAFFGISPVEAMWMDPQQRKLLEVVYETFESAGVTLQSVSGSDAACFIASFTADFQQMSFKEHNFRHSLAATGVDPGLISNRISHVFNLQGPSLVVNTTCSSSVYAIHNACNAIRAKECSSAVVGGVNLILTVDQHMNTAKLGVLSPTSTCHTFNEHANGYGRAEGVGAVYLKRLSDAMRDGNPIRGVIRSSATNSNGKVPGVGITHPSYAGQCAVIRKAYERGGQLDPSLTGYFECHGTGTAIGDPLEVCAVANSMNSWRGEDTEPLLTGAAKTNIGHSEAASGLSAVIKAILAVERGIVPPTRGVTKLNPKIDWDRWKIKVPTDPTPFPAHLPMKRVSINSFGYGGTNAHIIVEGADSLLRYPQRYRYSTPHRGPRARITRKALERNRPFLLPFSAHDKPTLKRNIDAHGRVVDDYALLDLSYTLTTRRTRFPCRAFAVATSAMAKSIFADNLQQFTFADRKKTQNLGFVFTGQGAQWARMGAELMTYFPSFLQGIKQMDMVLEEIEDAPNWSLEDTLLEDPKTSPINEAEFSQPLCTAVQVALVQLFRLWNIVPSVTCGHSSGEIAAAYAAGLISAAEAIVLAYYRGKVVREINTNGAMLAVGLGAEAVSPYIGDAGGEVVVACHNSPTGVTLSGSTDTLESIHTKLTDGGIFARLVKTGGKAYHSPQMQPAAAKYESLIRNARQTVDLEQLLPKLPAENVRMVSSITNSVIHATTFLDETYWSANLLSPVLFNQVIQTIGSDAEFADVDMLVEVGPHSALSGPIRQTKATFNFERLQYLPTLVRNEQSAVSLLKLSGELFLRDFPVDLDRVTSIEEHSPSGKIIRTKGSLIVDLPPYQWDKAKKFWSEARESREHRGAKFMRHDILGSLVPGCSLVEPSWRNFLRIRDLPWLQDHSLGGEAVFPAAGYFSMAMEAIIQLNELSDSHTPIEGYVLRDVVIKQALVTPDDDTGIEVMLNMRPSIHAPTEDQRPWMDFNISSVTDHGHVKDHIAGSISASARRRGPVVREIPNLPQRASGKAWNHALRAVGFYYGPTFRDMENINFDGRTYAATCDTRIKTTVPGMTGESRYVQHPASVDSCLQLLIVANWAGRTSMMTAGAVPIQADEIAIWTPTEEQIRHGAAKAFSWISPRGVRAFNGHSQLAADDGEMLMEIKNMRCTAYEAVVPQRADGPSKPDPYGEMAWRVDVSSLSGSVDMDIPSFVDLVDFKHPGSKIIAVDAEIADALLAKTPELNLTITEPTILAIADLEKRFKGFTHARIQTLESIEESGSQSTKATEPFDLVVAPVNSGYELRRLRKLVATGGRAVLELGITISADDYAEAGFSGVNVTLGKDSTVVTTAIEPTAVSGGFQNGTVPHTVHIVYRQRAPAILADVQTAFKELGYQVTSSSLESNVDVQGSVIMLELEDPLLPSITKQEFHALQGLTSGISTVFWATAGGLLEGKKPEYAMTSGFLRSLTSEQASLDAVLVDFDIDTTPTKDILHIIIQKAVPQIEGRKSEENEYCVTQGQTFISRLVANESINDLYAADQTELKPTPFDPHNPVVGTLQSGKVVFQADERVDKPLDSEFIEVRVLATGLNREDVTVISGTDFSVNFSHEISGIVTGVGYDTKDFSIGDRVTGFSFDKFATFQRVHQSFLQRIEPGESLAEVASLPMAYGAALYGLNKLAHLQPGETVLILPGSGLAGSAAVKVTKAAGGYPYVVAASNAQASFVQSHFNLGPDQVIVGSDLTRLRDTDENYKVDIMFSSGCVNSSVAREAWRHVSPCCRFVDAGRKNVLSRSILDTVPFHRGANYLSFDLLELHGSKPQAMSQLLAETIRLYRERVIDAPSFLSLKNITELNSTMGSFSDTLDAGKTVIMHEVTEGKLELLPSRPRLKLCADATYLLVGCLGGLGRSLTSWMMRKGARNFAFLSRSGADSKQASILLKELEVAGANTQVFRGDAGVKSDVENAIKGIPKKLPIRGVINAAMVLRDALFYNMPYENWTSSINPKVKGSMSLHEVLEDVPLDFFVTTSSVSGILGTPGQSNYAAGNSYLDSLARHRRLLRKKSTSIILPMVLGVGVVAENLELEESLKRSGMYGIDEEALLDAFEIAISEQQHQRPPLDHLVVGLAPAELAKASQEAGDDADRFWENDQRFSSTVHAMRSRTANTGTSSSQAILSTLKDLPPVDAVKVVREHFITKLAKMLVLGLEDFEEEGRSVASYGIDSMIGAGLRNWIFKELALDISFQQLLGSTLTITRFAEQVCVNQGILLEQ